MKYKRQLVGSVLAFTMMVGISSAFAADAVATGTKMHHVKNQIKMKDDSRNGKDENRGHGSHKGHKARPVTMTPLIIN